MNNGMHNDRSKDLYAEKTDVSIL